MKPKRNNMIALCYLAITLSLFSNLSGSKPTIHIGALIADINNGPNYDIDRFSFESAILIAERLVNENDNILANYKIKVWIKDTHALKSLTLKYIFDLLYNGDVPTIAIIGPGFSVPTKAAAEILSKRGVLQITHSALDPTLSDIKKYPYFFRSVPSVISINQANLKLMKYFNWKHVSLLYDYTNDLNTFTIDNLSKLYMDNQIKVNSIIGFSGFNEDYYFKNKIKILQSLDARIIIASIQNFGARKLFCEAYKRKMFGAKYAWIMPIQLLTWNWYHDQATPQDDTNCTSEEILKAAEGHLVLSSTNLRKDDVITVSNKTSNEVWEMIKRRKREINPSMKFTNDSPMYYRDSMFAFDAVWAISVALEKATQQPYYMNLSNFNDNQRTTELLSDILRNIRMEGVTGVFTYDNVSRERISEVTFKQWRNDSYVEIGYTQNGNLIFLEGELQKSFPNGIPHDKVSTNHQAVTYSRNLIVGLWLISILGIVFSLFVIGYNISKRNLQFVKMLLPLTTNNLICVGCILCFVLVLLHGVDSKFVNEDRLTTLCNYMWIILAIGFNLSFGGLLGKTWHVYQHYTSQSETEVIVSDCKSSAVMIVLTLIDVVFFVSWIQVYPFHLSQHAVERRIDGGNDDIINVYFMYKCTCGHQFYFELATFIYKGLILSFAMFLSWETRNVSVNSLNDSKYTGLAIYNTFILSVVGIVSTQALSTTTNHQAIYVVVAVCVCLASFVTLLCSFVPMVMCIKVSNFSSLQGMKSPSDITKITSLVKKDSWPPTKLEEEPHAENEVAVNPAKVYLGPE